MPAEKLSITMSPEIVEAVDGRTDNARNTRSSVISRDLDRYYEILKRGRAELRKKLSSAELEAILANLNGVWLADIYGITGIPANIADAIDMEGLDKTWKIDGAALLKKVSSMSLAELVALADASERFWKRLAEEEDPDPTTALDG